MSEDVKELGKVVGVNYQCDTSNTFNLLSREIRDFGGRLEVVKRRTMLREGRRLSRLCGVGWVLWWAGGGGSNEDSYV